MLEKELTSSRSNSRVTKLSVALIVLNKRFTLAPDSHAFLNRYFVIFVYTQGHMGRDLDILADHYRV